MSHRRVQAPGNSGQTIICTGQRRFSARESQHAIGKEVGLAQVSGRWTNYYVGLGLISPYCCSSHGSVVLNPVDSII